MNIKAITGGALAGLVLAGGAVSAQSLATATGLTEEQVIAIALEEVPGEVQEVELESEDGMQVYEVEVMSAEGVEMEVEIAAETGEVLEVAADEDDCDKDRRKGRDHDDGDDDDGDAA